MFLAIYFIGLCVFLFGCYVIKGDGFKQWWKDLDRLPYDILWSNIFSSNLMTTLYQYRYGFSDKQNQIYEVFIVAACILIMVYVLVSRIRKKQYRFAMIYAGFLIIHLLLWYGAYFW